MRAHSILATAASLLLASTIFAAAQGTQKQGPGAEGSPSQGQTQREGQQGKQAPQKSNRGENTNQKNAPQAQEREGPKGKQQVQQGQKEQQGKQQQGKQQGQKERTEGQGSGRAEGQKTEPKGKAGSEKERTEGQGGGRTEGSTTLTTEQKTRVRETVLQGSNAPRANNVNFQVRVGTTVPTSVRVVEIAPVLVELHPEWRGYFYFIVNDEIIVVDRNHRIVAVLAV
jgi:Protein of unknown function (DUF1236)